MPNLDVDRIPREDLWKLARQIIDLAAQSKEDEDAVTRAQSGTSKDPAVQRLAAIALTHMRSLTIKRESRTSSTEMPSKVPSRFR